MADNQPATMEEIALKLWALRTGQTGPAVSGEDSPTMPIVPLTVSKPRTEARTAN